MDDVDDLFGTAHNIEGEWVAEGRADGERDGKRLGTAEGWELGVVKGHEIGQEIGFYAGCVATWQQLLALDPSMFPGRSERGIASLTALLRQFSLTDPEDEALHERLEDIRSKFKAVASQLGVLEDYFDKEPPATLSF